LNLWQPNIFGSDKPVSANDAYRVPPLVPAVKVQTGPAVIVLAELTWSIRQ